MIKKWGNCEPKSGCFRAVSYTHLDVYKRQTGDREILEISAPTIWRYLNYIIGRADSRGLVAIGLGDWCPVGKIEDQYNSPLIFTDSVLTMDIAEKAAYIFERCV